MIKGDRVAGRKDLGERLSRGDRAGLSGRERALVEHAELLTRDPAGVSRESIEALCSAGLSDVEILDATQVIGYMGYANRIAQGLGVELERTDLGQTPG